ncbi:MAG: hypothetical protein JXM71_01865 [Spirochaetales bacterium]|nr:hypothetical protein [Spirochaetales bacterium]
MEQLDTTPAASDPGADEFVGFGLGSVGFVMKRSPFFAAVHRVDTGGCPDRGPASYSGDAALAGIDFLDCSISYNDRDVPMLRLDDFLCGLFRIGESPSIRVGLVARTDDLGPDFAALFRAAVRERLPELDADLVAFGIGGNGAIKSIPWRELRRPPGALRGFLWPRGVLACRFGEAGGVEFLIDPADIIFPTRTALEAEA